MKIYWLLICSVLPAALGWLSNYTLMATSIIYFLSTPATVVFCIWLGRTCVKTGWRYFPAFLLTQWVNLLSIPLYIWQFLICSDTSRNMTLAVFAQMPATPLLPIAFRIVSPFVNNAWAQTELLSGIIISVVLLAVLFTAGYLWGKRSQKIQQ